MVFNEILGRSLDRQNSLWFARGRGLLRASTGKANGGRSQRGGERFEHKRSKGKTEEIFP